jgi:hypothetical protein
LKPVFSSSHGTPNYCRNLVFLDIFEIVKLERAKNRELQKFRLDPGDGTGKKIDVQPHFPDPCFQVCCIPGSIWPSPVPKLRRRRRCGSLTLKTGAVCSFLPSWQTYRAVNRCAQRDVPSRWACGVLDLASGPIAHNRRPSGRAAPPSRSNRRRLLFSIGCGIYPGLKIAVPSGTSLLPGPVECCALATGRSRTIGDRPEGEL